METVLVIGSTGNIGIAAVTAAIRSGRNVLAVVRNQESAKKLLERIPESVEGKERITMIEADIASDDGIQGIVDRVKAGKLPAFQHVHTSASGEYLEKGLLDFSRHELQQYMKISFEINLLAYQATVPYLLEQKDRDTTFTLCTGAQGDFGERALPAVAQGALFSMSNAGCYELKNTNVRFNEIYLAFRVEYDASAEKNGVVKSSDFSRVYEQILKRPDVKSSRVRVDDEADFDELKVQLK